MRRKIACEVTRKSEMAGMPDHKVIITQKAALVYESLAKAGDRGITCRDWHGYDLRHFLRVLRNKGIGIDREWEKNSPDFGGQHGRWKLRHGHSHRDIPYPEKKKAAATGIARPSNPNTSNGELGGLSDG